jgi:aspartyl-tRNA(Asn)/glutamyl-tRNA(Gln) amidotransferase subunit C
MAVTRDEVAHLAQLSRLSLTEEELDHLAPQLDKIITAVARIQEVDASDVPATPHELPQANLFRSDVIETPLGTADALGQASAVEEDRFRVPRILAEG